MFDNIGGKIKGLAKVICWLGIIGSCALGIFFFLEEEDILLTLLIAAGGSLASWISCLALYGFGELIEKTVSIEKHVTAAPAAPAAPAQPYAPAQTQFSAQAQANIDRINHLKDLRAKGLITEEEYQKSLRGN